MWLNIPIDLDTKAANAHLLKELDRWKELGLLSEDQILSIGQELCSRLPIIYKATATPEGLMRKPRLRMLPPP